MNDAAWWAGEDGCCWLAALRGLARGLGYPDAEWVAVLLDGWWPMTFAAVLELLGVSADGIQQAIKALPAETAAALEALQIEYTYLFINAVPHVPAPPYASAYTGEGLLMGEPAEAALLAYRRAGLVLARDYHELPDHLAAELEFLAWLGEQIAEAYGTGDEESARMWTAQQQSFLRRQVQPWLSSFCRRVEEVARIPFYRELARLIGPVLSAVTVPAPSC